MGTAPRLAIAWAVVGAALVGTGRQAATRHESPTVSVSVGYQTPVGELRRWDAAVDRLIRTGDLVATSRHADRTLAGRAHERLAQHVAGIPVHGGGVARQLDRGVTVSLLGTLHGAVDLETAPRLSAGAAAARIAEAAGGAPAAPPRLVILPRPDGSYAPAYRAAADDGRIHFVDAVSGDLVRIEFALAADDDSWHYAGFAFTGGRFLGASAGCCPDGGDRNAAILNNAFRLAVEGGTNRGTGRAVAGAGPAHRTMSPTRSA